MHRCSAPVTLVALLLVACQPAQPAHAHLDPTADLAGTQQIAAPAPGDERPTMTGATPVSRTFKDYLVGCDNTASCMLISSREDHVGLNLVMRRGAGPAGAVTLKIVTIDDDILQPNTFLLDGKATMISQLAWRKQGDGELMLADAVAISRFLALAKDGATLSNQGHSELSLAGLKAALLFIDETQQRLDNISAFATPGKIAISNVPVPPPVPHLAPAYHPVPVELDASVAAALTKTVRAQAASDLAATDCTLETDMADIGDSDSAIALTKHDALVLLTCIKGAYQDASLLYRVAIEGRQPAIRIVLPPLPFQLGSAVPIASDILVGADYDPSTATLSEFSKGRGLADCGQATTWRFDGRQFQLASFSALDTCGGIGPDDWPVYWQTD